MIPSSRGGPVALNGLVACTRGPSLRDASSGREKKKTSVPRTNVAGTACAARLPCSAPFAARLRWLAGPASRPSPDATSALADRGRRLTKLAGPAARRETRARLSFFLYLLFFSHGTRTTVDGSLSISFFFSFYSKSITTF